MEGIENIDHPQPGRFSDPGKRAKIILFSNFGTEGEKPTLWAEIQFPNASAISVSCFSEPHRMRKMNAGLKFFRAGAWMQRSQTRSSFSTREPLDRRSGGRVTCRAFPSV